MAGRTVLITGASGGIGAATARTFARGGDRVALHYHTGRQKAEALAHVLREAGCDAYAVEADVSVIEAVERMVQDVEKRLGPVDVLVNNAGIAQQKMFQDITPEDWRRMFAVTVDGAFYCIQRVLPGMLAKKRGRIVNVSSMWGMAGASCESHYSAAKAALIGLTKSLARELGPSGITVNCVAPGVILTDMCAGFSQETLTSLREETPLCRLGTPEEVARAICFLAAEEDGFLTGQILSPNGGYVL